MSVNAIGCIVGRGPEIAVQTEPWLEYLANASRSPSADEMLPVEPQLAWRTQVGRAVPAGIAVTEALILAGTSDKRFAVLERETGHVLWQKGLGGSVISTPLVVGGTVYLGQQVPRGQVEAYDLWTGKRRWSARLEASSHLALAGDLLLVPQHGRLAAVDTGTGEVRWSTTVPGRPRAAPSVLARHVFLATHVDSAFLLDRGSGAVVYRRGLVGSVAGAPAVFSSGPAAELGVVAATTGGRVYAWRETDDSLAPLWEVDVGSAVMGGAVIARDTVLVVTRPGVLWWIPIEAPDAATTVDVGATVMAPPTPLARGVLVATLAGEIIAVDPAQSEPHPIARVDAPVMQPPLVFGGDLVVVGGRGHILLYR